MLFLPEITPGQGSMLSGAFTALGAILGVVVASRFFSGRVKSLKDALEESQALLAGHAEAVSRTLTEIGARIEDLNAQSSGLASSVGRIESEVVDLGEQSQTAEQSGATWDDVKRHWVAIRDEIERRASAEGIDGRRRAAYGRVDRRSYYELINKMLQNEDLDKETAKSFRVAFEIWQRLKGGKATILPDQIAKLEDIRARYTT